MAIKTKNNLEATLDIEYEGGHFYNNLIKYLDKKGIEVYKFPEEDRIRSFPNDLKITTTRLENFYQKVNVYNFMGCSVKIIGRSKTSLGFMDSVHISAYGRTASRVINHLSGISREHASVGGE